MSCHHNTKLADSSVESGTKPLAQDVVLFMDRTYKIACSFVALVSLVGLSACGDPDSVPAAEGASSAIAKGQTPKVIRVAPGGLGSAKAMAAPAAMAPAVGVGEPGDASLVHGDSGFASGVVQYVADARLATLDATAPSWSFPTGLKPDKAQIIRLAHAFGVNGSITDVPEEQGGGWRVGPGDGTATSLIIASDALLSWSVNPPYPGAPTDNAGCWGTVTPTTTVAGMASPVAPPAQCEPTTAPKNVPDKNEALAKAKTLFASLGYTHLEYEASADPMGTSVTGYELLGGVRSPQSVNVGYGENGRVTWAAGTLAEPTPGDDYPLIGTTAAIARLNEQGALGGGPYWPMDVGTNVSGYLPSNGPADEPMMITLIDARLDLSTVYGDGGTVWLLPAYTFASADGFAVTVIALPDEFIETVQPTPPPSTTAAPPNPNEPIGTMLPLPPLATIQPSSKPGSAPTTFAPPSAAPPLTTGLQPPTSAGPSTLGPTLDTARILVGLSEADAAATAKKQGWVMRVTRQDGADLIVTADFSTARINVAVTKSVVTEVLMIG
jgi:hypothetical protein